MDLWVAFRLRRCLILFLSWLAPFAGAQCPAPAAVQSEIHTHPQAKAFTRLGEWFDVHHQYECAAEAYRSALKLAPKSAHLFELLGKSLYALGDLSAAADALQQSIQIQPGVLGPHLEHAQALEQLHRTDEAKLEWEVALQLDPNSAAAMDGMSRHLIAHGDYPQAIALLRAASGDTLHDEKLAVDLAQAYGKSGMLDEAEGVLKKVIGVHPSSFPLTFALTTVLMNRIYFQEAADLAGKFATAHPNDVEAQRLYLRVLITSEDLADAAPLARKLQASHPQDSYFLYANGAMELRAGNYAAAKTDLQHSLVLNPDNSSAHFNLGLVLERLNDNPGAKQQFEEALASGGQEPEIHLELEKVLQALGQSEEAQQQLAIYKDAIDAQSARSLAKAKAVEAEQQLASGNSQKAIELYRAALQETPNDALLNYKLSAALDAVGDTTAERSALERAIQIDPDLALAQNQLGYLDFRSRDSAAAEEHFRQAVRAAPAFTEAWINLAATLGMESKFSEAETAIATALKLDPKNAEALQLRQDLAVARQPK
ncbi:exported hypothetical protein [Acidobacteriia bacterium SbA2]|nr:exported hypothetical protein [Acidobacteriia bacterium SbA2]